jgi:hypothetical protein
VRVPRECSELQTALRAKAKAEAGYRFYALYDKISREDILAHAYAQCRSNKGTPGVDGQDFADIEACGLQRWLGELALALRQETYRPDRAPLWTFPMGDFHLLFSASLPSARRGGPKAGHIWRRSLTLPSSANFVEASGRTPVTRPVGQAEHAPPLPPRRVPGCKAGGRTRHVPTTMQGRRSGSSRDRQIVRER